MEPSVQIYSGKYSYRRAPVAVVGVGLSLVTGAVLARLIYAAITRPPVEKEWFTALFVFSILSIMCFCGLFLTRAYVRNQCLELSITHDGVLYAGKFSPWAKIRWIAGTYSRGRYQLVIGRRGLKADYNLMIDSGLSEADYEQLMNTLRAKIAPQYSDVKIG